MNRKVARIIAIVLAMLMVVSVIIGAISSIALASVPTKEEIDKLRREKKEIENRKQEIQSKINTIEYERMAELAKKSVLDDRIILTGMEIDIIQSTIELYGTLIIEKEQEVEEAQIREDQQLRDYKRRVREMEENGVISYFEIIFDSTGFSDLLARLDFVGDMMQADEKIYNELIKARNDTIAAKEALILTKQELEDQKVLKELTQLELEDQLRQASALIEVLNQNIAAEKALYEEERAAAEAKQREINAMELERAKEEERRRVEESNKVRGTGDLMWPVLGYGEITSEYGIRMHPIYKVYRQHTGIDIGAAHGASVTAADTGTVIISSYDSSYGHYIVISHGQSINGQTVTTLYAHLSSRGVSVGDVVLKGDYIGKVGSTGVSTGPHLHFEVSIGGSRVNPKKYL